MREVSYRLQAPVYLERGGITEIANLAAVTVAGFVDRDSYEDRINYAKWPCPIFLYEGEEAAARQDDVRTYWALRGIFLTDEGCPLSKVVVPSEGASTWLYAAEGYYPSPSYAHLFDTPAAYDQEDFERAVQALLPTVSVLSRQ